jgi:hypothetical protein
MCGARRMGNVANAQDEMPSKNLSRLLAETELRRSQQIDRIAQLREQHGAAILAEVHGAEQVLKEIERTLRLVRAYRLILQSLD